MVPMVVIGDFVHRSCCFLRIWFVPVVCSLISVLIVSVLIYSILTISVLFSFSTLR